jgi:hypothetical protein
MFPFRVAFINIRFTEQFFVHFCTIILGFNFAIIFDAPFYRLDIAIANYGKDDCVQKYYHLSGSAYNRQWPSTKKFYPTNFFKIGA